MKDEAGNPHRGTWRCFTSCVDDTFLTDVLRSQDGEEGEFDPEKLEGYMGLDMDEKKVVKERLEAAAANREEVDAAQKLARAERKREEAEAAAEAAAKKAAKLSAKRAAAKAAKKGHLAVSTKGSSLVPCAKCGEHINKNFASMHECKTAKAPSAISFFGAAATKGKAAQLAAAAAVEEEMADVAAAASTKRKDADGSEDAPKKKKKKVKEEGQPKGALSAYFFFTASVRADVAAANPDKKVTELATIFGDMWKKMGDEEKAPFVAKAEADKARYASEMEAFNKPEAKAERAEAAASKAAEKEAKAEAAKAAKAEAAKAAKAANKSAKPKAAPKKKTKEIKKPAPLVYVELQCGCSVRQGWEWAHECKKPAALPAKTPLRDLFKDAKSPPADAASPPEVTSVTA